MELLVKLSIAVGLVVVAFGSVYVAIFYLPERLTTAKKILKKIELLDERSQSNPFIF